MKRILLINTSIVIAFILFDPLLNHFGAWADTYNLGVEMALGIFAPIMFVFFVLLTLCSMIFSIVQCFVNKDIKYLIPISVFVVGVFVYLWISNPNSFWVRLIQYML